MFEKIGSGLDGFAQDFQLSHFQKEQHDVSIADQFAALLGLGSKRDPSDSAQTSTEPAADSFLLPALAPANPRVQQDSVPTLNDTGAAEGVTYSGFTGLDKPGALKDLLGPVLNDLKESIQQALSPYVDDLKEVVESVGGNISEIDIDIALNVALTQDENGNYDIGIEVDFNVSGLPSGEEVNNAFNNFKENAQQVITTKIDQTKQNIGDIKGDIQNVLGDISDSLPNISVTINWTVGENQGQIGDGQIIDAMEDLYQKGIDAIEDFVDDLLDDFRNLPIFKGNFDSLISK